MIRLAALCLLALPAQAFDGVAVDGLLTDEAFFHAATCGSPDPGACQAPILRWTKRPLTVALLDGEVATTPDFDLRLTIALDLAIGQINTAGAAIRLVRVDGQRADIVVRPTGLAEGAAVPDVPGLSAPGIMGVGYMTLWWQDQTAITEASILISTGITPLDMTSVVLEEVYQSLGPRFDLEGAGYEGVSILSQTSNATLGIAGQDARLLQWLYPFVE